MELAGLRFPGREHLRRRVEQAVGPDSELTSLGHKFGDWLHAGPAAPPATVEAVEARLAGYLEAAATAGREWGTRVGLLAGLALLGVFSVLALLSWAVFG
ncbi:hypothetical protein ABT369_21585 [Dactylosporangium sp. NPDC000244]|uniref:hypothetical protein n=1 Tax=Dactylosporangium sp. NPDC000244 TaxID=3154365 RepID=UPI0033321A83